MLEPHLKSISCNQQWKYKVLTLCRCTPSLNWPWKSEKLTHQGNVMCELRFHGDLLFSIIRRKKFIQKIQSQRKLQKYILHEDHLTMSDKFVQRLASLAVVASYHVLSFKLLLVGMDHIWARTGFVVCACTVSSSPHVKRKSLCHKLIQSIMKKFIGSVPSTK